MKCPDRYRIIQSNYKKPIINNSNHIIGELSALIEEKHFKDCYQEDCMAYDKENGTCRKVWNNE